MFGESEIVEFSGSSLYALSSVAETLLCRYLGDLYHGKIESSGVDSRSRGRSSVHSDLFVYDASLANVPGIKLPPVFASEFAKKNTHKTWILCPLPLRYRRELVMVSILSMKIIPFSSRLNR